MKNITKAREIERGENPCERGIEPGDPAGGSAHRHTDGALQPHAACGNLRCGHGHFSVNIWRKSINLNADRHFTLCSATTRAPPVCAVPAGRGLAASPRTGSSRVPGSQLP